jgi:ABC-type sugar transport system ATPase subunit
LNIVEFRSESGVETPPILEISGMSKRFASTLALDDVALTVQAGEIHALVGQNGAGKSTLIKCVCGAYAMDAGNIYIDGNIVDIATPKDADTAGIAVVHQQGNLVPTLTVAENVCLGEPLPTFMGLVNWQKVHERARAVLERMELDIAPTAEIESLRPDQRAMVSIAKAVSQNARVIILDEPTAALMPKDVDRLFGQMRGLAERGHSFLYVSHRLAEVFEIAHRATVLRDGRNAGMFEREIMSRSAVVEAIVGSKGQGHTEHINGSPTHAEVVLEVCGLTGTRAHDVSFTLHAGEIIGVAGLPGSGAEEVLNLLFGRTRRKAGHTVVQGREVELRNTTDAIAAGFALVPQDRLVEAMFHGESVRSNISLPSLSRYLRDPVLRFIDHRAESRAAKAVVERMRVRTPGIETAIDDLSGGNQQKVILGRWLSTGARVFLLNSPTAAVDVGAKAEIYERIHELAADGAGIVFASSELEEYQWVCNRVLVFFSGCVANELANGKLSEANIMTLASGGTLRDE